MKTAFIISVWAVLLAAAPSPCFALWDVWSGSQKEAKELGIEIRSNPNGATELSMELEIKTEGGFKSFSREGHPGRVELQLREGKTCMVSAALKEDRSKPGRVVVSFATDRRQLDKLTLRVMVPYRDGGRGGAIYELRVKEFVEPAELPGQKESALKLTIETAETISKGSDGVSFSLSLHNSSATPLLLNGGELLGNGSQIWSSLEAELKTENGQRLPMTLGWGVPGVAGRIYFLGVPLRAGSSYKLPVTANDYFVGDGERLKAGKYDIRFIYRGRQSDYRDSTQMPACWEGEVRSNTLKFEVSAE